MTQLTINIEDKSILPHLKKILGALNGVSIAKTSRKKNGYEEAMDDIKHGRIYTASSVDQMLEDILG